MNMLGRAIVAVVVSSVLSLALHHYSENSTIKQTQLKIAPQETNQLRIAELNKIEKAVEAKVEVEVAPVVTYTEAENSTDNRRTAIVSETKLPESVADTIMTLAKQYDFYEETIVGVMNLESKYNPGATNYNTNGTTDMGLMQINSNTLPWLAQQIGNPNADPYNPHDALRMAVWYLHYLRDGKVCQGSLPCALDMYNGDSTGKYTAVVRERIQQVASRMGVNRGRMN